MQQHHITVPRTARYFTLGAVGSHVRRLWYVLHGYGQLAERFICEFQVLDDGETLVVAPEALSRMYLRGGDGAIGASWMTREDRLSEIGDYLEYLNRLHAHLMPQLTNPNLTITLLGFSQGGATAGRWVASGGVPFAELIVCGSTLPPELSPGHLSHTQVTFMVGRDDQFVNREELEAQRNALQSAGNAVRLVEFDGGHRIAASELLFF